MRRGGDRSTYPTALARMSAGGRRSASEQPAYARAAVQRAIAWRENRRCPRCGALGYVSCRHRPDGAHGDTLPTPETMPFAGHRTVAEVWGLAAARPEASGGEGALIEQRPEFAHHIAHGSGGR